MFLVARRNSVANDAYKDAKAVYWVNKTEATIVKPAVKTGLLTTATGGLKALTTVNLSFGFLTTDLVGGDNELTNQSIIRCLPVQGWRKIYK